MATKLRTARSLSHLADVVSSFLGSSNPSSRELMRTVIGPLSEIGEVVVIGGLVRDLAFYGPDERPISDIDLVVRGSPSMLALFAERTGAIPNRFGGYGLRTSAFKADFWSFSSTWARRAGHVSMRNPKDLIKSTFFDWDAVVYSTLTGKVVAIDGYIDRINGRTLDLNLEPNPSIRGNLVRALRRIMMWDVRMGPRLRGFVNETIFQHEWRDIVSSEKNAFRNSYLSGFSSTEDFITRVLLNPSFGGVGRDDRRQPSFDLLSKLPYQYHVPSEPELIGPSQGVVVRKRRRTRSETPDLFED